MSPFQDLTSTVQTETQTDAESQSPAGAQANVDNKLENTKYFSVYVCGAVANEGYYEVPEGSDYKALVELAGILSQTYFTQNPQTLVTEATLVLPMDWFDGEKAMSCINVNGPYVTMRMEIDGIDTAVINKIADYIEQHGKITDKSLLKEILGEDYSDNFYKFFVSIDDYEKVG